MVGAEMGKAAEHFAWARKNSSKLSGMEPPKS